MRLPRALRSLLAAIVIFTRVPIPWPLDREDFTRGSQQLPLLGWIVGGLQGGLLLLLQHRLTIDLSLFLVLLLPIFISGGMHEDGLADFSDGMLGAHTRERRLEIMKDPRIGTYGTLSLLISFFGNWLALRSIAGEHQLIALLSIAVLSRSLPISLLPTLPYLAHSGSKSQPYLPDTAGGWREFLPLWPAIPAFMLLQEPPLIIGSIILFLALHVFLRKTLQAALGGLTGDCLGASSKIAELSLLLLMAWLSPI